MRRVEKFVDSKILTEDLKYIPENSRNNKKIVEVLLTEQKLFCAYTDEYISRTDAVDVEHFNPTIKGTIEDNYNNWFVVKHQWNKEKSTKWKKFQPILHPTAIDFEGRVIYIDGDYIARSSEDLEARNLIQLLQLDDASLAEKRKKYISRKRKEIEGAGGTPETFFRLLISEDVPQVSYLRAIKEEFNIDIWEMLR